MYTQEQLYAMSRTQQEELAKQLGIKLTAKMKEADIVDKLFDVANKNAPKYPPVLIGKHPGREPNPLSPGRGR